MKRLMLIILPIILGIIGAFFRARELAFGFDFASGLPYDNLIITPVLAIVGIVICAIVAILVCKGGIAKCEKKKHPVFIAASLLGSAVMLALAALYFNAEPIPQTVTYIHCAITLLCAGAFAFLGIRELSANTNPVYSFFAATPVFWACFSLIMIFRERIADPIIADYIFLLFAFICILMFLYAQCGYVYRKNRFLVAAISAAFGTYCCVIEVLAPFIALKLLPTYPLMLDFTTLVPLAFFAVYLPMAELCILRNENNV